MTLTPLFTQDFLPKLRQHLLPRILSKLQQLSEGSIPEDYGIDPNGENLNSVLFQHDRIYPHNIMRINYTTYDVRRSQDVISTSTSRHNVMVLAGSNADGNSAPHHPFRYARVLGIYHVNVIYIGPGMINYQPHRLEFLWVRWYQTADTRRTGWEARLLDCIQFPSMTGGNAFGFIDPSNVVRSCHVIPAFARGRCHPDGKGLSHCGRDSHDWVAYYVNR